MSIEWIKVKKLKKPICLVVVVVFFWPVCLYGNDRLSKKKKSIISVGKKPTYGYYMEMTSVNERT